MAGATTTQMKEAPYGAVYIWRTKALSYPRKLAKSLGREDLKIIAAAHLCNIHRRGDFKVRMSGVIIDHAAMYTFNSEEWDGYEYLRSRIRRKRHGRINPKPRRETTAGVLTP